MWNITDIDFLRIFIEECTSFCIKWRLPELILWIYSSVFGILFLLTFFGSQFGLRVFYTKVMLKIFEFGSHKIQRKKKHLESQFSEDEFESIYRFESSPNKPPDKVLLKRKDLPGYDLCDILPFLTAGMASVVEDSVTPQFVSEELPYYWNLLSRTNKAYEFVSLRLTLFWMVGFIVRYCLLLPLRLIIFIVGMTAFFLSVFVIGCFPDGPFKKKWNSIICIATFDFMAGCLSLVATFHDTENMPISGIAVANHTSPIDSLILATNNFYDMVGQRHSGFLGAFMKIMGRTSCHIWFDRAEAKDRFRVSQRLRDHAADPSLPPVLIFPEGVCVNNTSVMQFKKGAFEVADEVHPIAIKFDPRFGDAFWWQDYFFFYILNMMTSWAIVVDVWYLPSMKRRSDETSIDFAKRVKASIAEKGGLLDLSWDGFLKNDYIKAEWRKKYQEAFANQILDCNKEDEDSPSNSSQESVS